MSSRRDPLKRSRQLTLVWLTLLVLSAATFPLWSGLAARKAAHLLTRWSSSLRVKRTEVTGNRELNPDSVIALAAIPCNVPLFSVSPAEIEARLLTEPWIRQAHVRRRFPQLVRIEIEERIPLAVLRESNLVAVSEDAVVLPPLRPDWVWDLPILSPPRCPRLSAGMTIADPAAILMLRETRKLKRISAFAWRNLSEMYYSDGKICATLSQPPIELILGHGVGELAWVTALHFVRTSGSTLTHQTLDLRFPGRIVLSEQPTTLEHRAG